MWLVVGGVLLFLGGAVWFERQKIQAQLKAQGWTPVVPGSAPGLPTAPAGVVPTVKGPDGNPLITLVPGNMGAIAVAGTNAFPPPSIGVQAAPPGTPGVSGIGWLAGVTSSNPTVVDASHALLSPGQPGQMATTLMVMQAGTSTITVQWNDGAKSQTSSFTVNATA